MGVDVLSRRALNRATLARQMLLERVPMAPYDAVRHLVGLQAQTPQSWYVSLWSRLTDFDPVATGKLIEGRRLVRVPVMRSTIHLVTDEDALVLRAFSQPTIDRSLRGIWGRRLEGIDLSELAAEVRNFTADAPRTPTELAGHPRRSLAGAGSTDAHERRARLGTARPGPAPRGVAPQRRRQARGPRHMARPGCADQGRPSIDRVALSRRLRSGIGDGCTGVVRSDAAGRAVRAAPTPPEDVS